MQKGRENTCRIICATFRCTRKSCAFVFLFLFVAVEWRSLFRAHSAHCIFHLSDWIGYMLLIFTSTQYFIILAHFDYYDTLYFTLWEHFAQCQFLAVNIVMNGILYLQVIQTGLRTEDDNSVKLNAYSGRCSMQNSCCCLFLPIFL